MGDRAEAMSIGYRDRYFVFLSRRTPRPLAAGHAPQRLKIASGIREMDNTYGVLREALMQADEGRKRSPTLVLREWRAG